MNSITKDTLLPIGMVIILVGGAFTAGRHTRNQEVLETKVYAIEVSTTVRAEQNEFFQKEVLQRLATIETLLEENRNGSGN